MYREAQGSPIPGFFPELVVQRRALCLAVIKLEKCQTVVEFGCGEGNLLKMLSEPAISIDRFPPRPPPTSDQATRPSSENEQIKGSRTFIDNIPDLNPYQEDNEIRLLIGLDLLSNRIQRAQSYFEHQPDNSSLGPSIWEQHRWEPLKIELWHGDLTRYNKRFVAQDCLIMSEVIEHLPASDLEKSLPLIFSVYRPRVVVITTPNYEFNKYIDQYSSADRSKQHRFLDPTSRTDRMFRDDDHQFEWTQAEFKEWCCDISTLYGYSCEVKGCGSYSNFMCNSTPSNNLATQYLPPPKSPHQFYATQAAVFRKSGSPPIPRHNLIHETTGGTSQLTFERELSAHASANRPNGHQTIISAVKNYMKMKSQSRVPLRELWMCAPGVDVYCGGRIMTLVAAFQADDTWVLSIETQRDERGMDSVQVQWKQFEIEMPEPRCQGFEDQENHQENLSDHSWTEIKEKGEKQEDAHHPWVEPGDSWTRPSLQLREEGDINDWMMTSRDDQINPDDDLTWGNYVSTPHIEKQDDALDSWGSQLPSR